MNLRSIIITLSMLLIFLIAAIGWRIHVSRSRIQFAGHTFYAPDGWRVFGQMYTKDSATFQRIRNDEGLPATIALVDRRGHPDRPSTFISEWKAAAGSKGFHPLSVDDYQDTDTSRVGLQCVAIRTHPPLSLTLFCTTSNGHWRLILEGESSDIDGLDGVARQIPVLGSE